jgi:hypothetical protein
MIMSQKSNVKQRVEPTNPSDLSLTDQQSTNTTTIRPLSPRYYLRSRDPPHPSAFSRPVPENHEFNRLAILEPQDTAGLSIAAYISPRRSRTPPLDTNNRVISPIRLSTPPPLRHNSNIQSWSADRLKTTFDNFRQINSDPVVRRPVAEDYIPLPDRLTTPARILEFTNHSTPPPQDPIQLPPAAANADRSQTLNILPFYSEDNIPQHNSIVPPAATLFTRPDSRELSDISEINSDILNALSADDADVEIQTAIRLTNTVIEERSRLFTEIDDLRRDFVALQRCIQLRNMEHRPERLQPNLDSVRPRFSMDDHRPSQIRPDDDAIRVPTRDTMHLPPTDFSSRPRQFRSFPSAPANTPNRIINPVAAAFKPEPFNGRNTFNANNWWQKFKMYIDLAQVDETLHCSILRLLLVGDAETWYNSLTNETQNNFRQLEEAFKNQYIDPTSNKFAMLSDLRVRVQGHHESLRTFLTEAGARLKAMGYPRELWLDLIYPVLLPSIQNVLQGFATHITDFDELLTECDRMERTARSVQPPPTALAAINAAQLLPFQNNDSSLIESIDKLQASIA